MISRVAVAATTPRESGPRADDGYSRLLIQALQGAPVRAHDISAESLIVQAATHHGVLIPLYRALRRGDVEQDCGDLSMQAAARRAEALNITHQAVELSDWLTQAGVVHAIVKGPAVALAYPDSDREFGDLDVLVTPEAMTDAVTVLTEHGARSTDGKSWPRDDGVAELGFELPSGVAVDLHADLIHRQEIDRDCDFPAESLLARLGTAEVTGGWIPVLAAEDALIHVAVHAVFHGGDRLLWLADIDALVRRGGIDWPLLVERAHRARLGLAVGVMLQRASMVLGTPVPRDALRQLRRGGRLWSRLLARLERSRPTAANFGRSFRGQLLVRSTGKSTLASLKTFAPLLWKDLMLYAGPDLKRPWRKR